MKYHSHIRRASGLMQKAKNHPLKSEFFTKKSLEGGRVYRVGGGEHPRTVIYLYILNSRQVSE